jgi:asparagine synthase (glutamine-hydrolysing)
MSAIFGIVTRTDSPVAPSLVNALRDAMTTWGPAGCEVWSDGRAVLGQARSTSPPEAQMQSLPAFDDASGFAFTMAGRLDERDELLASLGADAPPGTRGPVADDIVAQACYRRWGDGAPARLYGDWAFAAWHPADRKLVLARDHSGNTALYYHAGPRLFAFASSRHALLAAGLAEVTIDELYLAQLLIAWPAYHGDRTVHAPIRRLPPAHLLSVTPDRVRSRRYWSLEDVPELRLADRNEYVEAFLSVFDRAVEARVRSSGSIGVTLSGGLDSGAVTTTAAALLARGDGRLRAFTSVPVFDPGPYQGRTLGDELPLAGSTARSAANIDLVAVPGDRLTPVQAIRRSLAITEEPAHSAASLYWILAVLEAAREQCCEVLLTGQMGNGGISWSGDPLSQPLAYQLRTLHLLGLVRARAGRVVPPALHAVRVRRALDPQWCRASAINPAFARRLDLANRRLDDPGELPGRTPREQRLGILKPGRSSSGATWAEFGAAFGLEVRDPTADARLLAFCLSVPDRVFIDPVTGVDRWLIREAMKGRLPDKVRLNRRRGLQAADLIPRLRASGGEVDRALEELASGAATDYVDVAYMGDVWRMIQVEDTPEALRKAVSVLTRGMMAGLFVNGLAA